MVDNSEERILILLRKHYLNQLIPDEYHELEGYCLQRPSLRVIMQRLDNKELVKKDLDNLPLDAATSLGLTWAKIESNKTSRLQKNKVIKIVAIATAAAAAVLFLVLKFVSVFGPYSDKGSKMLVYSQQTAPSQNSNRAILIFSDGHKLLLENMANGEIKDQGDITIKKIDSNEISFNSTPASLSRGSGSVDIVHYNTLQTPRGGQFRIILPDGSHVWLNNASSLSFPTTFINKVRKVELIGEAYFEIARNAKQSFSVHTGTNKVDQTVEVLGTGFNISAYPDDPDIHTTLLTGKVRVMGKDSSSVLSPDEQVVAGPNGAWHHLKDFKKDVTPWKNGQFNFVDDDLPQVMRKVARWYDIEVVFEKTPPALVFQSVLPRNESLQALLLALSDDKRNFSYTIDDKVHIH